MKLGNLEEDDLEVLLGYDRVGGGHCHLHGVHVLDHDTETLQVDGLRIHNAVEDALVHQDTLGVGPVRLLLRLFDRIGRGQGRRHR